MLNSQTTAIRSVDSAAAEQSRELLLIDSAVADLAQLVAAVRPNVEVVILNAVDGLAQISQILSQYRGLKALHLVSHGASGRVFLGQGEFSLETLNQDAGHLQIWAAAMAPQAELLIYGCEVARGERGWTFIRQLSELTGASIAASATKTGSAALDGNWELEVRLGEITTSLAFQQAAMMDYVSVLKAGDLDPTFGTGGKVPTDFSSRDVVVQPDGKIIVVGSSLVPDFVNSITKSDFTIVRYNANGSLDTSFGTNGKVVTDFNGRNDSAYSVILQSDGKITVAGVADAAVGNITHVALARYNANGSLDTSFGTNGKVVTGSSDGATSIIQQGDSKIVVAGFTSTTTGGDFALIRYNINGNLDTSFGINGKVATGFSGLDDIGYGVMLQSDGKIVVAGKAYNTTSGYDFALARYNSDGSLDTSFGTDGKVTTSGSGANYSVVQQSDGKIIGIGSRANAHVSS